MKQELTGGVIRKKVFDVAFWLFLFVIVFTVGWIILSGGLLKPILMFIPLTAFVLSVIFVYVLVLNKIKQAQLYKAVNLEINEFAVNFDDNNALIISGEVHNKGTKVAFNVGVCFQLINESGQVVYAGRAQLETKNLPNFVKANFLYKADKYPGFVTAIIYQVDWLPTWEDDADIFLNNFDEPYEVCLDE